MEISKFGHRMILSHDKVAYLPDEKMLLIADIHLGKVSHFRKAGIGLPEELSNQDFRSLNDVIEKFIPTSVVIMGDLFHSTYNLEWEKFKEFIAIYTNIDFVLVRGNHDILQIKRYSAANISVVDKLMVGNLILTHEPMEKIPEGMFNMYGHIHPGVRIRGRSKQSLTLPCFIFFKNSGIMPAFGRFTGLAQVKTTTDCEVFVIGDNQVMKIST